MSIVVQQVIVYAIIVLSVAWAIGRIVYRVRHRNDSDACHCDSCPFANNSLQECQKKNMKNDCKKLGQNVASSDK